MSDNQDLKSKILLMRQKNFGEVVNEVNEKNDNQKPVNSETAPGKTPKHWNNLSGEPKDKRSDFIFSLKSFKLIFLSCSHVIRKLFFFLSLKYKFFIWTLCLFDEKINFWILLDSLTEIKGLCSYNLNKYNNIINLEKILIDYLFK